MQIDYTTMFEQLGRQVIALAGDTVAEYRNEAVQDATQLISKMKTEIERWGTLFANGQLNADELKLLIENGKTLMVMSALEQTGLLQIRLDDFINKLLNLLYNTLLAFVTSVVKPI